MSGNAWKEGVEEGKEGNYGRDGVVLVGERRVCPCRSRYGLHNGMFPETIRAGSRSGYRLNFLPCHLFICPLRVEFSLYTDPLPFGDFFLSFPVSLYSV